MSPVERASLEAMFKTFAPEYFERWSYLLRRKPERWNKISPMHVWPVPNQFDSYPDKPFNEILLSLPLVKFANTPSVVLCCGYTRVPSVKTSTLSESFPKCELNYEVVFEGFISVLPGKLALGFNHEGGVCVYGDAY